MTSIPDRRCFPPSTYTLNDLDEPLAMATALRALA